MTCSVLPFNYSCFSQLPISLSVASSYLWLLSYQPSYQKACQQYECWLQHFTLISMEVKLTSLMVLSFSFSLYPTHPKIHCVINSFQEKSWNMRLLDVIVIELLNSKMKRGQNDPLGGSTIMEYLQHSLWSFPNKVNIILMSVIWGAADKFTGLVTENQFLLKEKSPILSSFKGKKMTHRLFRVLMNEGPWSY